MQTIREAIVRVLAQDRPMTVRQVFYRLTAEGVIAKTEAEYNGTVCRLLGEMRRSGEIPYEWLADSTRWMRKPTTYSSIESALQRTAETYRRALWDDAPIAVEIWLEKEALAGVLVDVTDKWDVPLMVTRGYPSMSFLHSAALAINQRSENGQRTQIYYFGDRDPSGVDIDRAVVEGIGESLGALEGSRQSDDDSVFEAMLSAVNDGLPLEEALARALFAESSPLVTAVNEKRRDPQFAREADRQWRAGCTGTSGEAPEDQALWKKETFADYATFTRVAVTEKQVAAWDLPSRPTKKSDTRSKTFKGESVELDAIPPDQLRGLCEEVIERQVDQHQLDVLKKVETEERRGLERIAATLNGDGEGS
jgi:hypothetical protein